MSSTEPSTLDDLGEVELREERDFLLASLADLDAELAAGDIDDHDYIALKDGYTSRAAAVLRALDGGLREPVGSTRSGSSSAGSGRSAGRESLAANVARRSPWRRIAVASGVAAFAAAAGLLVARGSGERLPGAATTGSIAPTGPEADLQAAQADVNKADYAGAIRLYENIVRQDPGNVEALANRGWLLSVIGAAGKDQSLVDRGLASVRAAESADPNYPDAHFFAGEILLKDKGDGLGAAGEFCTFLSNNPPAAYVPLVNGELQSAITMAQSAPLSAGKNPPCTATPGAPKAPSLTPTTR